MLNFAGGLRLEDLDDEGQRRVMMTDDEIREKVESGEWDDEFESNIPLAAVRMKMHADAKSE